MKSKKQFPFFRHPLAGLLAICAMLVFAGAAWTLGDAPAPATQKIATAELTSLAGTRVVSLPNRLEAADFDPKGGTVRYRLSVELAQMPTRPLGIYVPKISQSGRASLNGDDIGSCETGPLPWIRCLNRPYLFVPPLHEWRLGANTIEFEVFATKLQMNGLSTIQIGDAEALELGPYRMRMFLQVELTKGLTWISFALGLIALSLSLLLRRAPVYFWFALTALASGFASFNIIIDRYLIDIAFYNWFIFAARLVSVPLLLLTLEAFFQKIDWPPWLKRALIVYTIVSPLIAIPLGNDRAGFALLYAPVAVAAFWLVQRTIRWTWQSRWPFDIAVTAIFSSMFVVGLFDWVRLMGGAPFESIFLLSYAFAGALIVFGALLASQMASSMIASREIRATLEHKVAERTTQLAQALRNIEEMERTALRLTENIPVGTYVVETGLNKNLHIAFASDRLLEILGVTRAKFDANSKVLFRSIHPEDYAGFVQSMSSAMAEFKTHQWTGRIQVNGVTRWVHVESNPRRLQGGIILWEGVVTDITEKKAAETALTQANAALVVAESERSRLEEREILLSDMHDGFGSQLAGLRFMLAEDKLDRKELSDALNDCAADLYLVIDTLSSTDNTLADAMADFRYRSERRLAEAPAKIHWALTLDDIPKQPQRQILQIMRIVQEALINALKHAGARNIWIEAGYAPARRSLTISVADDGAGMPQNARRGRGLINMARRARDLDAELAWNARAPGTEARLTMTIR